MSCPNFPSCAEGVGLHARLLNNDPTASADVCAGYLQPLVQMLQRCFPRVDEHAMQSAAEDAVLSYLKDPTRYQPEKGGLGCFLRMAARADLRNRLRGERRRKLKIVGNFVEEDERAGNILQTTETAAERLERQEEADERERLLARRSAGFTLEERTVLNLLRAGEKQLRVYVAALGLGTATADEQKRKVKRLRDRVVKRLQRGGKKHG